MEDVDGLTLVTGASGVVGRALVRALTQRGADVATLTRSESGDARDPATVARAGAQTIFHLAPVAPDAVLAAGARRVVVASSVLVYGAREGALTEDLTTADLLPAAVVARLSNVYGPDDPRGERLVPTLLAAARNGHAPRLRSDGSPRRDFVHADDAAQALLALASDGAPGEAYNIGTGVASSVDDVVAAFEAVLDRPLHPRRAVDDDHSAHWADVTKIAALGWSPTIPLAAGVRSLLRDAA